MRGQENGEQARGRCLQRGSPSESGLTDTGGDGGRRGDQGRCLALETELVERACIFFSFFKRIQVLDLMLSWWKQETAFLGRNRVWLENRLYLNLWKRGFPQPALEADRYIPVPGSGFQELPVPGPALAGCSSP